MSDPLRARRTGSARRGPTARDADDPPVRAGPRPPVGLTRRRDGVQRAGQQQSGHVAAHRREHGGVGAARAISSPRGAFVDDPGVPAAPATSTSAGRPWKRAAAPAARIGRRIGERHALPAEHAVGQAVADHVAPVSDGGQHELAAQGGTSPVAIRVNGLGQAGNRRWCSGCAEITRLASCVAVDDDAPARAMSTGAGHVDDRGLGLASRFTVAVNSSARCGDRRVRTTVGPRTRRTALPAPPPRSARSARPG